MRFATLHCRASVGLLTAISLVAIEPIVAAAQNADPRAAGRPMAAGPAERESLFGGGGINWPKMPFSRSSQEEKQPTAFQRTPYTRPTPGNAEQSSRFTTGQHANVSTPSRLPGVERQSLPKSALNQQQAPNGQRVANRSQFVTPPSMPNRTPSMPIANPSAAPTMTNAAAEAPAVRLLTQAHQFSATAQTESDFTRVIEACRQAQASQADPAVARYANELASWAFNRRGQLKAEAGQDQPAIADFDAAVKADGKRWRAVHNRGVLLAQNGQFERAFDDFTRTIQCNPTFAKAYSNRGALFVVAGNVESAIQDYQQAIELDPDIAVAYRGLGRACHLDGKLDEALTHYNDAVRLSPNDSYAIASLADVLTDLGRYEEAIAEYDRAIKADPNSSHANSGSAWLLATCPDDAIRDPQLALERAQAAIKLAGAEDAASFDTLAAAHANLGDFAAAKKAVAQAVKLASADEKEAYEERLSLYQSGKPYRLEPIEEVVQASHEE